MKPLVVISQRLHADAIGLLSSLCDVALVNPRTEGSRRELRELARGATALLAAGPLRVDDTLVYACRRLCIVACAYRMPEHIDISACTRRGVWVTNVFSRWLGKEAEIEAARNVLDALSGDIPRCALNDVLPSAVAA